MSSNGHLSMCVLPSISPLHLPSLCLWGIHHPVCVIFLNLLWIPPSGPGAVTGKRWAPVGPTWELSDCSVDPSSAATCNTRTATTSGRQVHFSFLHCHSPALKQLLSTLRNKEVRGQRGGSWGIWERARAQWVSQGGKEGHVTQGWECLV